MGERPKGIVGRSSRTLVRSPTSPDALVRMGTAERAECATSVAIIFYFLFVSFVLVRTGSVLYGPAAAA
eukprot:2466631-Pyramimonas_sp.AAC.1